MTSILGDKRQMVLVPILCLWLRVRLIGGSLQASPAWESWENHQLNRCGNRVTTEPLSCLTLKKVLSRNLSLLVDERIRSIYEFEV